MKKSIFLVTHVHEAGIQAGHQFLDAAQIHIAHGEGYILSLTLQLHQLLVFQQGNGDLFGLYIYYEFACHYNCFYDDYSTRYNKQKNKPALQVSCFTSLFSVYLSNKKFGLRFTSCFYVCSFSVFFYACALTFYVFFSSFR